MERIAGKSRQRERLNRQTRWHIIEVLDISTGDIKNKIQFRVPKDFKVCTQIMFTATTEGVEANGFQIGFLTLHFNNKRSNPIQYPVRIKNALKQRRKRAPITLFERLKGGTLIQGYYHASGVVVMQPYKLKIYIGGMHLTKGQHHAPLYERSFEQL